jgi:S-DNA-T family DNA segregation ATPase FtsK/SpoIIIE
MYSCDQCGFVHDSLPTSKIPEQLRSGPGRFRHQFSGVSPEDARRRAEPGVWSALEYTCHVRDVLLVQRERVVLALVEDRPSFARMYREERVGLCRYDTQPPAEALDQLAMAAELCAQVFEGIDATGWSRPLVYNWPEPATFDLAWLGRHTVHELEHHLQDVASVLERVTARNQ